MFMKRADVINLFNYFSNLKLNKFEQTRDAIMKNFDEINKVTKETNNLIESKKRDVIGENVQDVQKLAVYREEYKNASDADKKLINEKIKNECAKALELEAELFVEIYKIQMEEVDLNLIKINKDVFVSECVSADIDITPGELLIIEHVFENE